MAGVTASARREHQNQERRKSGILTAVVYLAASNHSETYGGANMCPWATNGCAAVCLGHTSGRLRLNSSQNSQLWKTLLFHRARSTFLALLARDISAHEQKARKLGMKCAVRLNGTSDIPWEKIAPGLFRDFPNTQFYDYTKSSRRAFMSRDPSWPANYHVTFSRSENTTIANIAYLVCQGINVAVVFSGPLPLTWEGLRVIDGDVSDYRPNDPEGVVVRLSVKGYNQPDTAFFVNP